MPYKDRERQLEAMREWRRNNPKKHKEANDRWVDANRAYVNERLRNYKKNNTAYRISQTASANNAYAISKCKQYGCKVTNDPIELDAIRKLYRICKWATHLAGLKRGHPDSLEVDHIIPIISNGPHTIENLQIISRKENNAKNQGCVRNTKI